MKTWKLRILVRLMNSYLQYYEKGYNELLSKGIDSREAGIYLSSLRTTAKFLQMKLDRRTGRT